MLKYCPDCKETVETTLLDGGWWCLDCVDLTMSDDGVWLVDEDSKGGRVYEMQLRKQE